MARFLRARRALSGLKRWLPARAGIGDEAAAGAPQGCAEATNYNVDSRVWVK